MYKRQHLYIIRIKSNNKFNKKKIFEKLRSSGVFVNIHYIPIYLHPYYEKNYSKKDFPNSNKYYEEALSIPIYPGLSEDSIQFVFNTIKNPINYQNLF